MQVPMNMSAQHCQPVMYTAAVIFALLCLSSHVVRFSHTAQWFHASIAEKVESKL